MNNNSIWVGEKELNNDPSFVESAQKEFGGAELLENGEEIVDQQANRRDFLKFLGFGLGAATVAAGCDIPVKRAIPYVIKPEEIVPGVATYYASTYVNGGDYCPVLVKTREGRPIKIEGNDLSKLTNGGTSARAQASVLSLYNTNRLKGPQQKSGDGFESISWADLDKAVLDKLKASSNIAVVSNTILSPTDKSALGEFVSKFPGASVISYDPVSSAAILEANEQSFGDKTIPDYKFDEADVIVSFGADFLGTWISPTEYASKYIKGRKVDVKNPKMSRHIQVESFMSMTGSNADNRVLIKPSEMGAAIDYLHGQVTGSAGGNDLNEKAKKALSRVADELKRAKGKSLIVSSSNNTSEQILVNDMNNVLGNYGHTISFDHASNQRQGNEKNLDALIGKMEGGLIDTIIIWGANPAYDYCKAEQFKSAMSKVDNTIAVSMLPNETTSFCDLVAAEPHYLESWSDAEAKRGHLSLVQPTINPLFDTRQAGLSFLTWASSDNLDSSSDQPYFEYLKKQWNDKYFASQSEYASFSGFWRAALHDGLSMTDSSASSASFRGDVASAKSNVSKKSNSDLEIAFYETVNMGNGQFASNPWLQEMPDPVARTTWGNYLAVPVGFDGVKRFVGMNKLNDGDIVELVVGDKTVQVPVIQQFGMAPGTVALALGYGRENAGRCGSGVGVNINDCLSLDEGKSQYFNTNVSVSGKIAKEEEFSCVQYHHTIGVKAENKKGEIINADEAALAFAYGATGYQGSLTERSVMYHSNLKDLDNSVEDLHKDRENFAHLNEATLYPFEEYTETRYSQGHHWGMHVDLNACIGCNACTISCIAENNVPVVGKKEVSRHHEMTWLRIDRYYFGDAENPNVVYQPMMCQHCDNAPCENVCPVNATNHSAEGLNQMAYNRCVGTRYCANNCPYKVRRFNWLDYTTADIFPGNQPTLNGEEIPFGADNLTRMVLNPDVTVRARGVIEKCSFCVQRIQEGKLTAKREGRKLMNTDVRTACQTACPTGAITFGDQNDKKGTLGKKLKSPLNFVSLEETNVQSSVNYSMKVVNRDEALDA
ncbi:MAG: TAT-variant-translocated molybdopterin oxidoreductase [Saprospiraceae bacterium]|nr:TAT-variant-translocated molybdopterin oxidoreductase [Saprospiraceae bacterium]